MTSKYSRNLLGFSLIELMVAIVVVAILAVTGVSAYNTAQEKARISKRAEDLKALQLALESYKAATGKYPTSNSGGCISIIAADLVPNYISVLPGDPLGSAYCYRYSSNLPSGTMYKISTPTNLPGNEMGDADFRQRSDLIDPAKDNVNFTSGASGGNLCVVDPPAVNTTTGVSRWAVYSIDSSSCTLTSE